MTADAMKCAYCGRESEELHRDHVVPRSRGGPDTALNLVMACQPCNSAKRDKTAIEWMGDRCPEPVAAIERRVNERLKRKFEGRDHAAALRRKRDKEMADAVLATADAIRATMISQNVIDSNFEAANVVDVLQYVANGAGMIARAIAVKKDGGPVLMTLADSVYHVSRGLFSISESIDALAEAIRPESSVPDNGSQSA